MIKVEFFGHCHPVGERDSVGELTHDALRADRCFAHPPSPRAHSAGEVPAGRPWWASTEGSALDARFNLLVDLLRVDHDQVRVWFRGAGH
jgi:hypothetical protein